MVATVKTSGSQTATIATEHTLATVTDAGTYLLVVDLAAMVNGDVVVLRIYGKARSGDPEREILGPTFINIQPKPLSQSIPIVSPHHFKVTLTQTEGTGRVFPWAVYEL